MAEKIQLQNRVMQEFEGKVRGDNVTFGVVGRVLDGRKVVNVVFFRNLIIFCNLRPEKGRRGKNNVI